MNRRHRRSAPVEERECGTCSACCFLLTIPSMKKEAGEPCPQQGATHLAGKVAVRSEHGTGCFIYANRPDECRSYACLWLKGHGREEMRPDRCGVIFDGHGEPGTVRAIGWTLDALETPDVRAVILALETHGYRVLRLFPSRPLRRLPVVP